MTPLCEERGAELLLSSTYGMPNRENHVPFLACPVSCRLGCLQS